MVDSYSDTVALQPRVPLVGSNGTNRAPSNDGHTVDDLGIERVGESSVSGEDTASIVGEGGNILERRRRIAFVIGSTGDLEQRRLVGDSRVAGIDTLVEPDNALDETELLKERGEIAGVDVGELNGQIEPDFAGDELNI